MKRLLLSLLLGGVVACSGTSSEDAPGDAETCTSSQGRLHGVVYLPKGALLTPEDVPADKARVLIRASIEDAPLYVQTDSVGQYSVDLDAGDWLIEGEHDSQCFTLAAQTVSIEPCTDHGTDVVLEECFDG